MLAKPLSQNCYLNKTIKNQDHGKPNCDDIYQYGLETATNIKNGVYDEDEKNELPELEDIYSEKHVTWIRRGWGENPNQIIHYDNKLLKFS